MNYSQEKKDAVLSVEMHEELQSSFIDYAISVIIGRALPDVKDGLKPSQRRIIFAMHEEGFTHTKPYRKSVRVVGDVLGKYHPHGDAAVYQTMVGMTQDFTRRYPLLDGQGNWGSIDGDNAAAHRYTEVRMKKICQELLADIEKDTVPFVPNYDESITEPIILPSKIPNLLVNGSAGIAVGMATFIPPHNLSEVMNACVALLENENISDDDLISYIKGPDFPLGGIIYGTNGIRKAYKEGKGSVTVRGIIEKEEKDGHEILVIKEIPYQVVKAELVTKIAQLVKDKIIEGISKIRDESNKKGIRVVIELKRDACSDTVMNLIFKHTQLQTNFHITLLAVLDNKPKLFTLRSILEVFLNHRRSVITKRTLFDKKKAERQKHILEGLVKVIEDEETDLNKLLKKTDSVEHAMTVLRHKYDLSVEQARAVLDLRMHKLISLERDIMKKEIEELRLFIVDLNKLLGSSKAVNQEIIKECTEIKNQFGDARRTVIQETGLLDFDPSAFIADEEIVITLTKNGYIKRVLLGTYEIQHRGGKGKMGMASLEDGDDIVQDIFLAKNHDDLLYFTNFGRVYQTKVYEVPESGRTTKGRAIVNVIPLQDNEKVIKLLCARNLDGLFLTMVSKNGLIKRTATSLFTNIRQTGIRALSLNEADELAFCMLTSGKDSLMLATKCGMAIRFFETEVRSMGRQAAGVRGIKLRAGDSLVGALVVNEKQNILFVTENGFGKRVELEKFRITHRGGVGVRTIPTDKRNGFVVGLSMIDNETGLLLIDENGKIIRIAPHEIRTMGRQAKGVRLIRLDDGLKVAGVATLQTMNEQGEAQARKIELPEINEEMLFSEENENEEDDMQKDNDDLSEESDFLEDEK
jgi:DNA gyrase subunit A